MWYAIIFFLLYIIECLPGLPKAYRYRNINALAASFLILLVSGVVDIYLGLFAMLQYGNRELAIFLAAQTIIIVIVKCVAARNDAMVKYGVPVKYTSGWRNNIISLFYDTKKKSAIIYTKEGTNQIGTVALLCACVLFSTIIYQISNYSVAGNSLLMPFSMAAFFAFAIELFIFCSGESYWKILVDQYRKRNSCRNRRELARVRYSSFTDFSYIFMKNFVWEPLHLMRATKYNWISDSFNYSIKYYDFSKQSRKEYAEKEFNVELEDFIKSNNLEVNDAYVAAYNFIERNQNVLIKTPSFVDFDPYFIAMIKMKIAKTKMVVLIVNNEENKNITLKKINASFNEYMGFDEIPLMLTIEDCIKNFAKVQKEEEEKTNTPSHFETLIKKGEVAFEEDESKPIKAADIIIISPEDIFDPANVTFLRKAINNLGLIVYYNFSDSVQEEALFAKIVHSVLDYDDKVSTLYMTDSFFDLEQVIDNFFSKRNIYEIIVPRKPSKQSYVMGWKSENLSELQSRTYPDASRDIGNHIPILYDAGPHTKNDMMIVEDEFDVYVENQANFAEEDISRRFDYHVGWTDVIGGESVMCTVSDTYNNVAHAYLAMSGIGSESEYVNIISRPYLLRNYLMYHLRFFTLYPGVLSSYSPGLIKTPKALSYEAIVKLYIVGCTKEQLLKYIEAASLECPETPDEMIKVLVQCAGCEDVDLVEITKNLYQRYFIDYSTYIKIIGNSGLVDKIEFVTNRHVYIRNKRDYNYLIPHQKIVLDGVKYTVEKIEGNRVELTDSNTREPVFDMRPIRTCKAKVLDVEEYGSYIQNNSGSNISFRRLIADVELNTYGNIVFKDSYHPFSDDARYDYHSIIAPETKQYAGVNIFNISIGSRLINADNCHRISHLLALLLNEMLPTFFPRHSKRIIVACNGWEISADFQYQDITSEYIVAQSNIENYTYNCTDEIQLFILEDSPIETGLVNVFWQDEEFRYMLKILEDYLYFQEMIYRKERKEIFAARYDKDLRLLKRILLEVINETSEIEVDSRTVSTFFHNSIRTSRNKFNSLEIMNKFDITCDYCGKRIAPKNANEINYHYYAYSGMVSCMDCFTKAVCGEKYTQSDIRDLEAAVNAWFREKYKDEVTTEFYNYLEDEERIMESSLIKDRLVVTDDYDCGVILGLASNGNYADDFDNRLNSEKIGVNERTVNPNNGFDEYVRSSYFVEDVNRSFILVKDGMPYKEYMGVLTHEMTHQWQFANLDFELLQIEVPKNYVNEFELTENMDNFRVEGMAEWERIRYLKSHGARRFANHEARVLRATRNAYGYGYIWMCNFMKVGHDDKSIPVDRTFSFIMKRNYYQLTKNSFALMRLYFGKGGTAEENSDDKTGESSETSETPETVETAEPFET